MFIGKQLKEARKEKGLTQEQLANKVGVSVMTIRRFESDSREAKQDMIKKLAIALETDEMYFLLDVDTDIESFNRSFLEQHLRFQEFLKYQNYEDIPDIYESHDKITVMISAYYKLNETGKEIAVQRVQELTEIERYTKPDPGEAKNGGEN